MKPIKELKRLAKENACCRCQYFKNKKCNNKDVKSCVWKQITRELEKLEYIRKYDYVIGDSEKGTRKLWWEHIRIIVDDKTKEIWQGWDGTPDDKAITLNDCLKIAKKELGYTDGVMIILCESFLDGIIYRYGNHIDSKDFEIAGKMHGFA